ncbi:hypothetical protein [Hydrogenophaga sp.]|uniref:hypothetical protein n=1 Tax=Hydrogenophaga sp. TaxID=1904254 RepID=UPI003919EB0F
MKFQTIAQALACTTVALASSLVFAQTAAPRAVGPATQAAAERAPVNFNGVWEMLDAKAVTRPGGPKAPYTEKYAKEMAHFTKHFDVNGVDDRIKLCDDRGMPWVMSSRARTYPHEIYQNEDRMFMLFEGMDTERNVHIGQTAFPTDDGASVQGYSIGRWEGKTLVIETRKLMPRPMPDPFPRSAKARVIERWTMETLPEVGDVINVEGVYEDPEVYTEPQKLTQKWKRAQPGVRVLSYNCPQALWDNHLAKRKKELGLP